MDPIIAQLSTSAVIVSLMEWLKETKLVPFMDHNSSWINRLVSLLFAFIAGIGLGYMYDPTSGVLTITGLQMSHVANTVWATFSSYGTQWLIYKGVIRKGDPGQVPLSVTKAPAGVVVPSDLKVVEQK